VARFRYPVKSMRGEPLDTATLGWHGLDGDRRLALRRLDQRGGFPFLTASKLPELIHFTPHGQEAGEALPTHVRTPEGDELPVFGEALAADIGRRHGAPVEMMQLKHGIFDEASISVITSDTARDICRLADTSATSGVSPQHRGPLHARGPVRGGPVGRRGAHVRRRRQRFASHRRSTNAAADATSIRRRQSLPGDEDRRSRQQNTAGIYATVTRIGRLAVGQRIVLHR
jgi:hypothetical protein